MGFRDDDEDGPLNPPANTPVRKANTAATAGSPYWVRGATVWEERRTEETEDDDEDDEDDEDEEGDDLLDSDAEPMTRAGRVHKARTEEEDILLAYTGATGTPSDRFSVVPRASLYHRVRSIYTPVYDFRTPDLTRKQRVRPRYCGGRLSRCAFIWLHLVLVAIVCTVVLVPVMLLVVVPKVIEDKVQGVSSDMLDVQVIDVLNFTSNAVQFHFKANIPPFFPLPIWVKTGAMTFSIETTTGPHVTIMNVNVPELSFKVSDEFILDFTSEVTFPDTDGLRGLVANISSPQGLNELGLTGKTGLSVTVFGIRWYYNLPVHKDFTLTSLDTKVTDILGGLPSFIKSKDLNSLILSQFNMDQLVNFFPNLTSFPLVAIDALGLSMNDKGPLIDVKATFQNPTIVQVPLPYTSFGISLQNTTIGRVGLQGLTLATDLNTVALSVDFNFLDPTVAKPADIQTALQSALSAFLDNKLDGLELAVVGPISLTGGDFVSKASQDLVISVPTDQIFQALNVGQIQSILSSNGIAALLANTSISASITDTIVANVTLPLPRFLPLPASVPLNFGFSAAVGAPNNSPAMVASIGSLSLQTTKDAIRVHASATITPNNTLAAAQSLADALNPALSAHPSAAFVAISSLAALDPVSKIPYKWSTQALADINLDLTLPRIDMASVIDGITRNGTRLPVSLVNLTLAQSDVFPGFDVTGAVGVAPLDGLPEIAHLAVDVGFVALDVAAPADSAVTAQPITIASVELPKGLSIDVGAATPSALAVTATLARGTGVSSALGLLANAVIGAGDGTGSFVAITGLQLGKIVTFSRLVIEIDGAGLKEIVGNVVGGLQKQVEGTEGLVKIVGVGLDVRSGADVGVGVSSVFANPTGVEVDIGSVALDVEIDGQQFVGIMLDPITLPRNVSPFNLNVTATLPTNGTKTGVSGSLGTLLNQILSGGNITPIMSIKNLVLTPRSPAASANATIDQLKAVNITIGSQILDDLTGHAANTTKPIIDLSALMPTQEAVRAMNLSLASVSLHTAAGSMLNLATAMTLTNPAPIAATIPFATAQVDIAGETTLTVTVENLNLATGRAGLAPSLSVAFGSAPAVAVSLAELVSQMLRGGNLLTPIAIRSVSFGTKTSPNDLLSTAVLNVTALTSKITGSGVGDALSGVLPVKFPATLSQVQSSLAFEFASVSVATAPGASLALALDASLGLPFALDVDLGIVGVDVALGASRLVTVALPTGLKISGGNGNALSIKGSLAFSNDAGAQGAVADFAKAVFVDGNLGKSSMGVSNILLGSSASDTITALSKIDAGVELASVLSLGNTGAVSVTDLAFNTLNMTLGGVGVVTKPGALLGLDLDVGLGLGFPLMLNIGNVAAVVATGGVSVATFGIDRMKADGGAKGVPVAAMVSGIFAGSQNNTIDLASLVIGASATDQILTFSKAVCPIPLAAVIARVIPIKFPATFQEISSQFALKLNQVNVATAPGASLALTTSVDLGLPFSLRLNLGYIDLDVPLSSTPLITFAAPKGLAVGASGPLGIDATLAFSNADTTQTAVAALVSSVFNQGTFGSSSVGARNIRLGVSSTDVISALAKINIVVALKDVLTLTTAPDLGELLVNEWGLALGQVDVSTKPGQVLNVGAGVSIGLPFPVSANLATVGAGIGTEGVGIASVTIPNLAIKGGNGASQLNLNTDVIFADSNAVQTAVADLVDKIFAGLSSASIALSQLTFGVSTTDQVQTFAKVELPLNISQVISKLIPVKFPSSLSDLEKQFNIQIASASLATAPQASMSLGATVSLSLPMQLNVNIGAVSTNVNVNDAPLVAFGTSNGLALTNGKPLNLAANLGFSNSEATQGAVASLVNTVMTSGSFGSAAIGVDTLRIGSSLTDTIHAFEKIKISVPLSSIVTLDGSPVNLASFVTSTLGLAVGSVAVATKPNKELGVDAKVALKLPFPVALDIKNVAAGIGANGVPFATAVIPGVDISIVGAGAKSSLNLDTAVQFVESDDAENAIAKLVNDLLGNSASAAISLNGLAFGASSSDQILSFAKVNLPVGLQSIVASILGGPIDLDNSVRTLMTNTLNGNGTGGIGLLSASVVVQSGSKINLGATAKADFALPFPLTVEIGNIDVSNINIDGVLFADAGLGSVSLATGATLLLPSADITIATGDAIAQKIGDVVSAYTRTTKWSASVLNVGGITLGASSGDSITAFSKVAIGIKIDGIAGPISTWSSSALNNFLAGIPNGAITKTGAGISIALGQNLGVSVSDAAVSFQPQSVINTGVKGGLQFPLAISAQVPFLGINLGLDDVSAFQTSVTGVNVKGQGGSDLDIQVGIAVSDTDALADKVAALASAFFNNVKFPGSIVIAGVAIGASNTDTIGAFSKISIPIALDSIMTPLLGNSSRNIDVLGLLTTFGFGLNSIDVNSYKAKEMMANIGANFEYVLFVRLAFISSNLFHSNSFPVSLTLPYLDTNFGIDQTDVMNVGFTSPFVIAKGSQGTTLGVGLNFPSSPTIQSAINSFAQDLYTEGWGNTPQVFAISGLQLGYSSTDYIKAFSKARIGLPSSSLLSLNTTNYILKQLGFNDGVAAFNNATSMLDRLQIQGANLDLSTPDVVSINASSLITGIPFDLRVNFPYLYTDMSLLGNKWIKFEMDNLVLQPVSGGNLLSTLLIRMQFYNSPELKSSLATVVSEMVAGGPIPGVFSFTNFLIGPSPSSTDAIDALAMMVGELSVSHVTDPSTPLFNSLLGSLTLNDIALGVEDEQKLSFEITTTLISSLPNIYSTIPYLHIETALDDQILAVLDIKDISFNNGLVHATGSVSFERNLPIVQKATDILTNVLFRRPQTVTDKVDFRSLRFGASKESALTFVDSAIINFNIANFIESATNYVMTPGQTMELTDLHTTVTELGVNVAVTGTRLPPDLPFRSLPGAGGTAKVMWAPQGTIESYVVDVYFSDLVFIPGQVFTFNVDARVNSGPALVAFQSILPAFVEWKPYLLGILVGHATLTNSDPRVGSPKSFNAFDSVTVVAPDLFFYAPLLVQPKLMNPFTEGLGLIINLHFANPGPLHVELGNIGVKLMDRSEQLGIVTIGINTLNNLEGGNTLMGNTIPIDVKITLNIFDIFMNLFDLLTGAKQYELVWFSDKNAPWIVDLLNGVPKDLSGNLIPIIIAVLRHLEIKLGPFTLGPLPGHFTSKADEILAWGGNHVYFGDAAAVPQAMAAANASFATTVMSGTLPQVPASVVQSNTQVSTIAPTSTARGRRRGP
ncbi:hypothetical protein HK101_006309 [Irineochytrium annulatum]|nr:hypothetical protein HK101_006309 [Irineochytrium annulatum]